MIATLSVLPVLASLAPQGLATPDITTPELAVRDVRVSHFSTSSQDCVSLAEQPDGSLVAVWHSRRQEEGTYGVRARVLDASGAPRGEEVAVNGTTLGMQMTPTVASDPSGAVWFGWVSRGLTDTPPGIYVRRFAADLDAATREIRVDDEGARDVREPSIAALDDGRAIVVWIEGEESSTLMARIVAADGSLVGAPIRVDAGIDAAGVRTPTVVARGAGAAVVFATHDAKGVPQDVVLRELDDEGALGEPLLVDRGAPGLPVEPVVAANGARFAIGWLAGDANGDYEVLQRDVRVDEEEPLGDLRRVDVPEKGYTSGLAIDLEGDSVVLVFGRYLDADRGRPDLYVVRGDEEPRLATKHTDGKQAMAVGGAGRRAIVTRTGCVAVAWHGDAGQGDSSAAHVSLLGEPGELAEFDAVEVAAADALVPLDDDVAAPHEVPVFDPKDVEPNGPGTVNRALGGNEIDFLGFNNTGWTPPDPEMAVGMDHIVTMVNGGIKFFDKQGTQLFSDQIEGSGGFWGQQGATGFVFDPEVLWDPHTNRFMAIAAERSGNLSFFLFAVSDDANPVGNWFKYRLNVTPIIGDDIDSVNLSVDDEAVYLTGDWFSPTRYFIYILDKSSILNGGTPVTRDLTITGRHSMGAPVNYDTNAGAAYFIFAPETTSSSIRIYGVTDPLGSPSAQFVDVAVPQYTQPADPPQMGTSNRPELFEARFWNAVLRNGSLWATHHQGAPARQRWYEFDMRGWPTSGMDPVLLQSGQVDPPGGGATYFGSLWVNDVGQMSLTCATSSSSSFISMARTGRSPLDAPGTTLPLEFVRTSTSPETSGRWGDYSATNDDPANPGIFWGHHEYREGSWRTRVASHDLCPGGIQSYCTTSPNSVGAGALITGIGSPSLAANDLTLQSQGSSSGAFGVFFFGNGQDNAPTGDGVRCVGGTSIFRLGVTQSDVFGLSTLAVDLQTAPASIVTTGSTWYFQYFYRDIVPGGSGLNFSDGLAVTFCD